MIAAGSLNRRLTLYGPIAQRSATGTEKSGWKAQGTVWAAQESLSLREIERMAGLQESAEAKFVIRYRESITAGGRVRVGKTTYDIVSVEEIGLREGIRLLVRAV